MDLTRPVTYRSLALNTVTVPQDAPTEGCMLEAVDYSAVPGIGYTEKRSAADGLDASDIFLGSRRIQLQGTVYGKSRADLFDRLQRLRYAFSPTAAYAESPGEYGYLEMNFEVPTLDSRWPVDAPTGQRFMKQALRVRPLRGLDYSFRRDMMGGKDEYGGGIAWGASLEARDPRVYSQDQVDHVFPTTGTSASGTFVNRGDYPAPLMILLNQPKGALATTFNLTIGGSIMHIVTPANANKDQILRYDGTKKVLTLQIDQTVSLRMDLLKFDAGKTHPLIPAGNAPWSWTRTSSAIPHGPLSHMWFWESWA